MGDIPGSRETETATGGVKAKSVSLWVKLLIVAVCSAMCILKGFKVFEGMTVNEIWTSGLWAYAISCGTIDVNIMLEKFSRKA